MRYILVYKMLELVYVLTKLVYLLYILDYEMLELAYVRLKLEYALTKHGILNI